MDLITLIVAIHDGFLRDIEQFGSGSPHLLQFDGEGTWVATTETLPDMGVGNAQKGYDPEHDRLLTGERWVLTRY